MAPIADKPDLRLEENAGPAGNNFLNLFKQHADIVCPGLAQIDDKTRMLL